MGISSVNLVDLQVTSTVVGENWQKSVNTLVSSLKKNRVCLVNLPAESASSIIAVSSACDKFFDGDSALKREFSYIGTREVGYRQEPTREVYEIPVPMHTGLRTPACLSPWTEQAYTVLDRTARVLLQSLSMSSELELSPYALFPLLDFAPCAASKMSSSSLEISRHLKAGAGLSGVDAEEVGGLTQREDAGLLTLVSAWEQGLQVQTSKGVWLDVPLSPNQVAVMAGYTLWHCTAGLLEPSIHRMLFRSRRDSMMVAYRLAARPTAIIDTPHIMAECGHPIPDRFRRPMPVQELMEAYRHGSAPHSSFVYSRTISSKGPSPTSPPASRLTTRTPSPTSRPAARSGVKKDAASAAGWDTKGAADQQPSPAAAPSIGRPNHLPSLKIPGAAASPPSNRSPAAATNPPASSAPSGDQRSAQAPSVLNAPHAAATPAGLPASTPAGDSNPSAHAPATGNRAGSAERRALGRNAAGTASGAAASTAAPAAAPGPAPRSAAAAKSNVLLSRNASAENVPPACAAAQKAPPSAAGSRPSPRCAPVGGGSPIEKTSSLKLRPRLTDSETKVRSEDLQPTAGTPQGPSYLQPTTSAANRRSSRSALGPSQMIKVAAALQRTISQRASAVSAPSRTKSPSVDRAGVAAGGAVRGSKE